MENIMTVRAPDNFQRELKEYAQKLGYTRNALVLKILHDWVNQQNEGKDKGGESHEKEKSGAYHTGGNGKDAR